MTLSEQLADAKEQYHALMTGNKPRVVVDQNGERVEFTSANAGRLMSYIQSLEAQLGTTGRKGPAQVFF